jgi:hypothetical protein
MRKPSGSWAGGPSGAGGYFADMEDDLADLDLDDLSDLDDLDDLDSKLGFGGGDDMRDGGYMGNVLGRSRLQPPPLLVPSMMQPNLSVYVTGLEAGLQPNVLTRQVRAELSDTWAVHPQGCVDGARCACCAVADVSGQLKCCTATHPLT